jgi:hypothetical protein
MLIYPRATKRWKRNTNIMSMRITALSCLFWLGWNLDFFEASWRSGGVILDGGVYGFERRLSKYTVWSSFKTTLTPH